MTRRLLSPYKWLATIGLFAVVAYGFIQVRPEPKSKPDSSFGVVTRGDVVQHVMISGVIAPNKTTTIVPPYEGYIRKLYAKVGDVVKEGDPLVTLSQLPHSKNEQLYPIVSPFTGVVVQVLKSEGEFVDKTGSNGSRLGLLRVDDLSKMFVLADVPEIDYPKLKIGQSVEIRASALSQKTYKGKILTIARASKAMEGWDRGRAEYPVRIQIDSPDADLAPGMTAMVDVITSNVQNVLVLRHEFVRKVKDKYVVTTSSGEDIAVTVGEENEDVVEVRSGVSEGAMVKPVDFLNM